MQAAVTLAFISAVADPLGESVLSAVQLLWVNLIMDTMAALALATEPPTPALLNRPPHSKADPLISFHMWRMIIGQAILQVGMSDEARVPPGHGIMDANGFWILACFIL